jgi:serine/threonine protein kinase
MSDRFGEYRLIRYLTAGGMADLYLARGPKSQCDLVLKRIQTRYADKTRVVKMFIDEGRIAQTLDHPNIVKVVDVGNLEGAWYSAMEYIAGHDAARSISSTATSPPATWWFRGAARRRSSTSGSRAPRSRCASRTAWPASTSTWRPSRSAAGPSTRAAICSRSA